MTAKLRYSLATSSLRSLEGHVACPAGDPAAALRPPSPVSNAPDCKVAGNGLVSKGDKSGTAKISAIQHRLPSHKATCESLLTYFNLSWTLPAPNNHCTRPLKPLFLTLIPFQDDFQDEVHTWTCFCQIRKS